MIQSVESFFARMMSKANIDAMRDQSDGTREHKFLIKQVNLINMMAWRVDQARTKAGLPVLPANKITNIIKTSVWNNIYSVKNVEAKFKAHFSGVGKSIFVTRTSKGDIQVLFYSGRYAETRTTKKGKDQPLVNAAMQDLWFKAVARIKIDLGEKFESPLHPGSRNHGEIKGQGFQATIANQVLAEGGGEGIGYDDAVKNFSQDFLDEWPGEEWLMEQALTQIFNPIAKTYKVKDVQDFTNATGTRNISVIVEYGDAQHNRRMKWADADGIRLEAKKQTDLFLKYLHANPKDLDEVPALKGSDSFQTKAEKIVKGKLIEQLLKVQGTRPDFRLKVNKKLLAQAKKAKGKKKSIGKFNLGAAVKTSVIKSTKAKNKKRSKRPNTNKKGVAKTLQSPIALRNLLNEALPQMVASKMTQPALQYRTGRFANSARVENVAIGPRGGLHIDYTYMRNPYETFEPGNKQGSTQRDPRKIIGASIRELAMGIIGRQPTSIRRN